MIRCVHCGSASESDSNYCDQCGEALQQPEKNTAPALTQENSKVQERSPFPLYVSTGLIALFIGLVIYQRAFHHAEYSPRTSFTESETALRQIHDLQSPNRNVTERAAHELGVSLLRKAPNARVRKYMEVFLKDLLSEDLGTRHAAVTSLAVVFDPKHNSTDDTVVGPLIEGLGSQDLFLRYLSLLGLRLHWLKASHEQIAPYVIAQLQRGLPVGTPTTPGVAQETLALYQSAASLGLEYPFFFSRDVLKEIIRNRTQSDHRPTAVVIMMKGDPKTRSGLFPFQNGPLLESLIKQGYAIMVYQATQDLDLANAIEDATRSKKSSFLLLYGHAIQKAQFFGNDRQHPLDKDSVARLKPRELWRHFEKGSQALVIGCNSGEGGADAENVANDLRQLFPKQVMSSILAPVDILYVPDGLAFDQKGHLLKFLPGAHMPALYEA